MTKVFLLFDGISPCPPYAVHQAADSILPEDSRLFILNHDDKLSVVHFDGVVHLTKRPYGRDMWARRVQPDTKSATVPLAVSAELKRHPSSLYLYF